MIQVRRIKFTKPLRAIYLDEVKIAHDLRTTLNKGHIGNNASIFEQHDPTRQQMHMGIQNYIAAQYAIETLGIGRRVNLRKILDLALNIRIRKNHKAPTYGKDKEMQKTEQDHFNQILGGKNNHGRSIAIFE